MLRFFSKRYSNKRKNKLGLKISNPILMQDGEANYPAALLNLSTTIPVQRPDSERNLPGSMHGLDANYLQEYHPVTIDNDQNKHFSNFATNLPKRRHKLVNFYKGSLKSRAQFQKRHCKFGCSLYCY